MSKFVESNSATANTVLNIPACLPRDNHYRLYHLHSLAVWSMVWKSFDKVINLCALVIASTEWFPELFPGRWVTCFEGFVARGMSQAARLALIYNVQVIRCIYSGGNGFCCVQNRAHVKFILVLELTKKLLIYESIWWFYCLVYFPNCMQLRRWW